MGHVDRRDTRSLGKLVSKGNTAHLRMPNPIGVRYTLTIS